MSLTPHAFPHIFEAIFAHASREGLISLRAVSTEFRDRADALLFKHVQVFCGAHGTQLDAISGGRLPMLPIPDAPSPERPAALARLAERLYNIRAVDQYTELPDVPFRLDVLRQCTSYTTRTPKTTAHTHVSTELDIAYPCYINSALHALTRPLGVKRSVMTLRWIVEVPLVLPTPEVREVVYVLKPPIEPEYDTPVALTCVRHLEAVPSLQKYVTVVGWASLLVRHVGMPLPTVNSKISDVPDSWLTQHVQYEGAWWRLGQWLEFYMTQWGHMWSPHGKVRFLTHAEWAAEAGEYINAP
ncbi:hypothetical protein CC85DRAFT_286621 [Cutaneotrichosporon oleaginosum]|uniref:Uncharacterized protein n=1 Tax=Cutaneotrichosporon oleaginosum TaxID=879819 RepID=A0A0J1B129_9TREE|nr:uncharacterized protein CC85DRAFT_286621 [Cutaneotrichosporon oleaginosum]KLT41304.1 hypothetical protein CC85DRAFT_286621 [Cutaneotrichosporon oleaginosum]TXT14054.1 hypothetical protein COLE_00247 [Cutaneotrichosporon oleaginosum]